jgi:hypothetical protein
MVVVRVEIVATPVIALFQTAWALKGALADGADLPLVAGRVAGTARLRITSKIRALAAAERLAAATVATEQQARIWGLLDQRTVWW